MTTTPEKIASSSDADPLAWLNQHRPILFAEIASLRKLISPIRAKHKRPPKNGQKPRGIVRDETIDAYREMFKKVEKAGSCMAASGTRPTFYAMKAAAACVLAERLADVLTKADNIKEAGKQSGKLAAIVDLEWALYVAANVLPLGQQFRTLKAEAWQPANANRKQASHGQRRVLGRLPKDWRARVWERTGKGKYADAVAVAACAGLRPAELENGVKVELADDGRLVFTIAGAKVSETGIAPTGVKVRKIIVGPPAGDPMAEHLKTLLADRSSLVVSVASKKPFCDAFRSASRKAFPKHKDPPSAYVFRHAFCANAKAEANGLTPAEVAAVMGHASTDSQKHYGMASQASGGWSIEPAADGFEFNTPIRVKTPTQPPQTPAAKARSEAAVIAAALGSRAPPRAPPPRL